MILWRVDKHQSVLQIDSFVFRGVARHAQSTLINKFSIS